MKVAVYSRKSRMTGKGESIKNQIDLCKEHMNKYFEVKEFLIYEDEGSLVEIVIGHSIKKCLKMLNLRSFQL